MKQKEWVFSKYNIIKQIKDSDNYYIVNLLTENADIITADKAEEAKKQTYTNIEEWREKGYLIDPAEEEKLYKKRYLDFQDQRENEEMQIFFVSNYSCNFSCSYCYQQEYEWEKDKWSREVIDAFYAYIDKEFHGREKYITLFGGEPLLNNQEHQENVAYLLENATDRNLDVAIVTNGYYLSEYVPLLKKGRIREVQVTLDGPEIVHDSRRHLKNRQPTFQQIVKGIDLALKNEMSINLRVVLDKENMDSLMELADFCIAKGWTKNALFKTQLGRNYNLHTCQSNSQKIYTRLEMHENVYELVRKNKRFLEFHKPAFSISKYLFENGQLPLPLFDDCPACKSEWAFDYRGGIYSCTATVGKSDEKLGTFYPEVKLDEELVFQWQDRDVTAINECKNCALQLACGGGCASIARNKSGKILAPDCRPVAELTALGVAAYFNEEDQEV